MEFTKLPPGEPAPEDADKIVVIKLPDGRYGISGMAKVSRDRGAHSDSFYMLSANVLPSAEAALEVGYMWAGQCGVSRLYIETTDA